MDIIPASPYDRLASLRNDPHKRLLTFENKWSHSIPVTPYELVNDGFYYTGLDDKVQCTHCGGMLSGWCPGDVVHLEHARHFPHCPWVKQKRQNGYQDQGAPFNLSQTAAFNFSHNVGPENFNLRYAESLGPDDRPGITRPKFQEYSVEASRLASFKGWPSQMRQKPEDISKAGFFYLGEGDKAKCFYCGGILWDWEPEDLPWDEHAKWFPDCPFLKLAKGDQFIQQIQQEMQQMQIDEPQLPSEQNGATNQTEENTNVKQVDSASSSACGTNSVKHPVQASSDMSLTSVGNLNTSEQTDVKAILDEIKNLKEQRICKICMDEEVNVIFLPCGHLCCCASCAVSVSTCPICRGNIEKSVKAYLA